MRWPFFKQFDMMDCGPTCLRMIAKYHGRNYSLQKIRALCDISRDGVSLLSISDAAEKIGFRCRGVKRGLEQLKNVELPCILHWAQNHFVVLYRIKNKKFTIGDPSLGIINYSEAEFVRSWASDVTNKIGVVLLLAPTNIFHELAEEEGEQVKWKSILRHVVSYKKLFIQLLFGLLTGSIIQLITPFLTQSIVDVGISTRNINFIVVILIAQATLIIGRISLEYMRSWILLHISTRISVSILTEFLIKLMRLPISFFDTKQTGDIMQRMNDQRNIEVFLTGSALTSMFSILNLLIFSIVLVYYNVQIFLVFLIFSTLYMGWIMFFLKNRRLLNNKSFEISAKNQSSMVQLISGMQEIKLNNCEKQKRWDWENIQAMLFNFNLKSLQLNQYQHGGASLINEFKNLLITFLSVKAVISGELTFGGMVALQFIIGQLNGPLDQIITFVQSFQDAKISLERLNEIHALPDEQQVNKDVKNCLPRDKSLFISDLTFSYPGSGNYSVLTGINLVIPEGKTTAIVGMSGSGKTTILKLLLRFYDPQVGEINVGNTSIRDISYKVWRDECGVVMQDGFIFSATIEQNIAVGEEFVNPEKLNDAIKIANLIDFIENLPLGLNTKIGPEGNGISQGQKQRILIARAVYKNPEYLFFDEATNALDANNELIIMNSLQEFFYGKTVVIVAHRLSTVNNADNIIVLEKGKIIEQGTHSILTSNRGPYYNLVKNQLELGA